MALTNKELALVKQYQLSLRAAFVRGVVLVCGDKSWALQCGASLLAGLDGNALWIGDGAPSGVSSDTAANAKRVLGQDNDVVVFNCYSGFHPDGFGALCGTITGGGVLVLLAPSYSDWVSYQDPDYQRITAHNTKVHSYNFIQRVIRKLEFNKNIWNIFQDNLVENYPPINAPAFIPNTKFTLTTDQQDAFAAIKKAANGRTKRPLVITSDRGRGKSTVLGVAAAELLKEGFSNVAVCAPNLAAVHAVFSHAQTCLPDFTRNTNTLKNSDKQLFFMPPDELLRSKPSADIVLIDEAAAIPTTVLKQILLQYPRVVFATTVHGYEGNGRGFSVRFTQALDELRPQWRRAFLQQAVRWAKDDFLEPLVAELLLLNASESKIVKPVDKTQLAIRFVSGVDLIANEAMLSDIFGLLVQAHYRTSPDDLRIMLDGSNIKVAIALIGDVVAGAVLVATEGVVEQSLHQAIERGDRRVAGHLAPQVLAAQAGVQDVLSLACWRVMRIAVHPKLRRSAIGSALLAEVFDKARSQQQDYLATSFAITTDVFEFWQRNDFGLQHLGWRRDSVSGAYTSLMTKPISDAATVLFQQQTLRLQMQFPIFLRENLQDLEAGIAVDLIKNIVKTCGWPNSDDMRDIMLFVQHQRSYETSVAALSNAALALVKNLSDQKLCELVVGKVLQHKSWQQVAGLVGYDGKADMVAGLKQAYKTLK